MNSQAQIKEVIDQASGKVYLPPCQIACPVGEDIQRTNTMISMLPPNPEEAKGLIQEIGDEIYGKNPLFTVCGYICGLCENECNYRDHTGSIRRTRLKRFLTDYYLPYLDQKPAFAPPTKEKVAVIGGGPGGLMCAYMLSKQGYAVTILERGNRLGGALRYIPLYRLPEEVTDRTINNLVRIANIGVQFGVTMGDGGKTLADLKSEGYQAVFVATGTHLPRPLTFGREKVEGTDMEGVMFGLSLLQEVNQGLVSPDLFQGKQVIVVGGGNVAFDAARTARRLGGNVQVVCLECEDKSSKDAIPADEEEIEGATEEGISIYYSRGVREIVGENGKFKAIKSPRCTSVFDESGFNPQFDESDEIYIEGDVLLVTIGQGPERGFFQQEDLLNKRGRLDVDQTTLMSNRKEGVFIGGDVRRVGFAADAMHEGTTAAESIDRYIKGVDLKADREKEYEKAEIPQCMRYKAQPELRWVPAGERLNFQPFEETFTLQEAIEEARRCLDCGPCESCKACVKLELQSELPEVTVNEDLCSGCGVCVAVCRHDAPKLEQSGEALKAIIDETKCKRCGLCVSACPSGAINTTDELTEFIDTVTSSEAALIS